MTAQIIGALLEFIINVTDKIHLGLKSTLSSPHQLLVNDIKHQQSHLEMKLYIQNN